MNDPPSMSYRVSSPVNRVVPKQGISSYSGLGHRNVMDPEARPWFISGDFMEENTRIDRLARFIARSGHSSRRGADRLVESGQVTVNGHRIFDPAYRINPDEDRVKVGSHMVKGKPPKVYYVLNKPRGYITGRKDPRGRASVHELFPRTPFRLEPVGRLDFDTEGALLLTNDGDIAHKLTHPSTMIPRRYLAKIYRTPTEKTLQRIQKGVTLEDGRTGPCLCRVVSRTSRGNCWIEITVHEGRNRLIRRIFAEVGHPVNKLRRLTFATISVKDLPRGKTRRLGDAEVRRLQDLVSGRSIRSRKRMSEKARHRPSRRGRP